MLSEELKKELGEFLGQHRRPELLKAYLFFVEKRFRLSPVAYVKERVVFADTDKAVSTLEKDGKLWRETEIKIGYGSPSVNESTRKIYICPFTGKVFGDNTHPNPQDAIYDWVAKCPENTERVGGVRAKRFFISEDPEVIAKYIKPPKKVVTKTVYSSAITGKLFNSKEAVILDFKDHYLKPMTLLEVQDQRRFQMHPSFLEFVEAQLQEEKIATFVAELAEHEEFHKYVAQWVESEE